MSLLTSACTPCPSKTKTTAVVLEEDAVPAEAGLGELVRRPSAKISFARSREPFRSLAMIARRLPLASGHHLESIRASIAE